MAHFYIFTFCDVPGFAEYLVAAGACDLRRVDADTAPSVLALDIVAKAKSCDIGYKYKYASTPTVHCEANAQTPYCKGT